MPLSAILLFLQLPSAAASPPKFLGTSESVAAGMFQALGALDGRVVEIKSDEGLTRIELLGNRVHEVQPTLEWAFDGKRLYVRDKLKRVFTSGVCKRHRAIEVVATVTGRRVDLFTKALLLRRTPLEEVLDDSMVRVAGFVAPNGVPCDILRADYGETRSTIFVRRKDRLPLSITTATSYRGELMSSFYRQFTFSKLAAPQFVLWPKKGEKIQKFPVLKAEQFAPRA